MTCGSCGKAIIIDLGPQDEAIGVVQQIVKDLHDLDKSGFAFRYSHNKGDAFIALPDHVVDLENIREIMQGVSNFFDYMDAHIEQSSRSPGKRS